MYICLFNDTTTTEIYTLSLHDALPISKLSTMLPEANHTGKSVPAPPPVGWGRMYNPSPSIPSQLVRSEEHTSELQSRFDLVCRLLLEKKKQYYCDNKEDVEFPALRQNR